MIRIEHVSKTYRRESQQIPVLKDIQLVLEKGDFIALMGPSGSGKSTLSNLIAGLDRPTSGTITIDNKVISGLSEAKLAPWRARHVGFIFQLYNLIPVLTALENVELQVESFVAARGQEAQTGGPSTLLETRFLQRVVAAMADYASARSGAAVPAARPGSAPAASAAPARPVAPAPSSDEGFEGLTALDILELTQRLDTLFEHTSFSESPAPVLPGVPTPPARPTPVTSSPASSSRTAAASPRPPAAAVASQPAGSPRRSDTIELLEKMLGEEKAHARSPAPPGQPPRS